MDIIISAPQGAGKSELARKIASIYLDLPLRNLIETINKFPSESYQVVGDYIKHTGAEVVIFDGCLTDPEKLGLAIAAVKHYRRRYQSVHPLLAIYIEQQGGAPAVVMQT